MKLTEPFVLKRDVLLIPCTDLRADVRERISFDEGDYTLSHRHGRALAQVIDGETAALLQLFREPRTLVDAVIENSRAFGRDARGRFDELLPHFRDFVRKRVLVPADAEQQEIHARYESGTEVAGWTIVRCASLIEDSEIYQVRNGDTLAALKIGRLTTKTLQEMLDNEAAILRHLDGSGIAPRLIESGHHEECPYLVMEWLHGVDAGVAAAQKRHDRPALIELCASIASAYASLHEHGVLHGDVHQRNIMVAGDRVVLLDYGFSRFAAEPPRVGRGGLYTYFEPEYLADPRTNVSARGEQYSLAALLYFLVTGRDALDFRYEREEMVRQALTERPEPFAKRGVPPWPEVEAILFRALEKDPALRHDSIATMARLLAEARASTLRDALETPLGEHAHELLDATLQSLARGGAMYASDYREHPNASINHGAAGAAVGLLRIAESRGDAALLATSNVWRWRAEARIGTPGAYYDDDGLRRELLGDVSPYHTESGIHAAAAMIAAAMGDPASLRHSISAFLRASRKPCPQLDLTLGRSGSLLAASLLLGLSEDGAALRAFGAKTMTAIWRELDERPPIAASPKSTYLGIAHGWAGYLYAALRWCEASGDALPPRLVERLHEHAAMSIRKGRGAYWNKTVGGEGVMPMVPGWCNGAAGEVFLFTLAHRLLGDARWLELAELSAWNTWDEPRTLMSLCCGSAGRAYALLNLYKHTGATEWLARARELANHAASAPAPRRFADSLWKGRLGAAVLIADLASPENARMPFFE